MGDFVRPESRLRREISTVNSAELETQQLLLQLHTYGQVSQEVRREMCCFVFVTVSVQGVSEVTYFCALNLLCKWGEIERAKCFGSLLEGRVCRKS